MPEQPHILVVDDERDIRDPLAAYLQRNGLRVAKAENAATARQILSAYAIDLVLLDIMMPHASGLEVLAEARRLPHRKDTPVIILTAKGQDADRRQAMELGATDFFTKPFSPKKLLARVDELFAPPAGEAPAPGE
ncbi:MAG TPA: response regulator [Longimicrobium sp.]|nr:response regulator [Longimicrobium sp.]